LSLRAGLSVGFAAGANADEVVSGVLE